MSKSDLTYGVSFSAKQCRNFKIEPEATLNWLLAIAGFRRFRLMSYWNEHERSPGTYDFSELDNQIDAITAHCKRTGVPSEISLCLGVRQPRWPENHWPDWAWNLPAADRSAALLRYVETVVLRYRKHKFIVSWQLENEALLANFGKRVDVDRGRILAEYQLVKRLDANRPIIMTTSASWGIPLRAPIPDIIGFSYYYTQHRGGRYHHTLMYPWYHRIRRLLIRALHNRPVFVHELQLEPWGPRAIWEMDAATQNQSMNPTAIARNLRHAVAIRALPIDLWGAEWWYWRHTQGDDSIWNAVRTGIS